MEGERIVRTPYHRIRNWDLFAIRLFHDQVGKSHFSGESRKDWAKT